MAKRKWHQECEDRASTSPVELWRCPLLVRCCRFRCQRRRKISPGILWKEQELANVPRSKTSDQTAGMLALSGASGDVPDDNGSIRTTLSPANSSQHWLETVPERKNVACSEVLKPCTAIAPTPAAMRFGDAAKAVRPVEQATRATTSVRMSTWVPQSPMISEQGSHLQKNMEANENYNSARRANWFQYGLDRIRTRSCWLQYVWRISLFFISPLPAQHSHSALFEHPWMMADRLNFVVLATFALSNTISAAVSGPQLRQRQDWTPSATSSSSYNYWWPYPPWGASTTTSASTTDIWTAPVPTTLWWTPPTPTPAITAPAEPEITRTSMESSSSFTEAPSGQTSDIPTNTSSSSPAPLPSNSTLSTSRSPSPSVSSSSTQSKSPNFKPVYLISIFAVCALAGGIGIAFYVTKRRGADQGRRFGDPYFTARLETGDAGGEKGFTSYADHGQRRPILPATARWWSVQKFLPRLHGPSKYFKLGGPRVDRATRSMDRPPVSFPALLSSPDPKGAHFDDGPNGRFDPATYGYGQWHDRSVNRHLMPGISDLSRACSKEGDAEELEIDLSKGWRHYSSLYSGSPKPELEEVAGVASSISSTKKYQRGLSQEMTAALIGDADDKFTSLPRREVRTHSTREGQSPRGHAPFLDRTRSDASSVLSTRSGRGGQRTEQRRPPSYSSDEAEGSETERSNAALSITPRSPNGGVRHKSIRRILAERMKIQSEIRPIQRSFTEESNPFSDSVRSSARQPSADQLSLNDVPPSPIPLRVTRKRQDAPRPQSVTDVVRQYDERVRERRATGTEVEDDIGLSDVEALVEQPRHPVPRMNTKYRRTQQWLKDAPGPDDDITLARAAFLSRATTLASTIPSVYSPETDHASPMPEDTQSTERLAVNGLGLEYDRSGDVLSAAEMAKAARRRHKGDEVIKNASTQTFLPPIQRPKYPFPELPSEIMSPPLEADLFFSEGSLPSSPPWSPSHPATATKVPSWGQDNTPLKLKANRRLHSPRSSPLKTASPTVTRLLAAPAPTSNRLMGPHRTLARNATTVTTITNRSVTPPPSHFTSKARAEANSKVDMIVQKSWEAKDERPTSPTGFGARSEGDLGPPAVLWRQGGGPKYGHSPIPDGVEGDGYAGGIEQRLAFLRENGMQ
ncbi:hypothetical protein M407DRAFT_4535 [Tulasnella calospora MUT 4182]|uniref:Uncharacterized protein n=1 Tax=Tulasnella calospora MUT 4182 TaxID=1051891 RepID=A0A0C3MF55_9AGAM|nr:hypothetical protein M407DRAFT_4535 [Tulasnella calospora MUT 4182]